MFKRTMAIYPTECTIIVSRTTWKFHLEALMAQPMRDAVMKGGRQSEGGRRAEIGIEQSQQASAGALCRDSSWHSSPDPADAARHGNSLSLSMSKHTMAIYPTECTKIVTPIQLETPSPMRSWQRHCAMPS